MKILGIILIVIGLITLAVPYVQFTEEKKVLDVGPIEAVTKEQKTFPISPVLGITAAVIGTVLVVVGVRQKA